MKVFFILLALVLINSTNSKAVYKKFYKSDLDVQSKIIFLTKFDFGPNGGNIKIKSTRYTDHIQTPLHLMIEVVLQQNNPNYLQVQCLQPQRRPLLRRKQQVAFHSNQALQSRNLLISQLPTQNIHYLYLSLCQTPAQQIFHNQNQSIQFQITMYNDQSHFGQDQKLLPGYFVMVFIWVLMIIKFAMPIAKTIINSQDKVKITVFTSLIILGFSYFYRLLHLGIYYINGKGIYFFQILYIILKTPCQFIIVTLIIAVGWGWSITHLSYDQSYILAGVTSSLINIICLILNGSAQQMVQFHHKYDSTAGHILLCLRVLILFIFLIGIIRIYNRQAAHIRKFIKKLALVGGLYLASWPIIVIFTQYFLPNYMHNQVITILEQTTHLIGTWLLCQMFAHPESAYRKISIKEQDDPLKMQNYKRK